MSPKSQTKGLVNIPAKTAMHVSFAAMIAVVHVGETRNPAGVRNALKINLGGAIMNRISCYFERISDFAVGLFLLFVAAALTAISFTIIPVIGLFIAIPVLVLAVSFLGAKRSKECALVVRRTKNLFGS